MSGLRLDKSGVIGACPKCGKLNRMAFASLGKTSRCGSCREELEPVSEPLEVMDSAVFRSVIKESSLPLVVDFWAEWCGPCKMFAPEFARTAKEWSGRALFLKLNTGQVPDVSQQLLVNAIPTIILWKSGKERERIQGAVPGKVLTQAINKVESSS
ncbi:MAG: trxA 2 [Verrucomicrobiales bacterium]|nr:trxA 2 [Verrucomicrobiales bacterium]